jgi:hypothetical protein
MDPRKRRLVFLFVLFLAIGIAVDHIPPFIHTSSAVSTVIGVLAVAYVLWRAATLLRRRA